MDIEVICQRCWN